MNDAHERYERQMQRNLKENVKGRFFLAASIAVNKSMLIAM